jgi:hypothetical protein
MLTLIDLVGLLPLLIVASTAVLVMLGVAWRRHHGQRSGPGPGEPAAGLGRALFAAADDL